LATGFDKPDFRWVGTQNRLGAAMAYRTVGFESSEITDADASDGIVEVSGLRFTVTAQGDWTLNFSNGRLNFAEDPAYASSQFKIEITNVTGGSLEYNDFILNYQSDPLVVDGWAPYLNFAGWSISDADLTGNYTYNGAWSYKHQIPGFPMPGSGVMTKLVITDNPAAGSTQNPYSSFWLDQLVVDTDYAPPIVAPTVGSVSSSDSNRAYKAGDVIHVTVTFDQVVEVNTAGGTPTLQLETGNTDRVAVYSGGNGTKTLTFKYTVQAGDTSADLDYISSTALSLNGATIKLAGSTTNATLTLPTPGTAGSLGANKAIIIDTSAPNAPATPDLDATFDGGVSSTDNVTNHATLTFNGAAEAGVSTVKLYDSDGITEIGSGSVSNGSYSITTSFPLADETHTIIAKAIDTAGNVSAASSSVTVTVDTAPPTVSITSSQSVLKAGETATITFTFSEDPGSSFSWDGSAGDVTVSGGTLSAISGTGVVRTATFTPSADVGNGTASITVNADAYADLAGNLGAAGVTPSLHFDTLTPGVPSAPALDAGSDSGSFSSDKVTNDTTLTVTGTAEAGSTIRLYGTDGVTEIGTGVASGGVWSITTSPLAAGRHVITARATDAAGNRSPASAGLAVIIDDAAPTLVQSSPVDGATNVASTADLVLTFSEAVHKGTGTIELHDSNGALIESFDVATSSRISITGNALAADPTNALSSGIGYYLTVSAGALTDAAGNSFAGIGDASIFNFTIARDEPAGPAITPNEQGGRDINITDPAQLTAALGTSGVDHVFYSGSGTVILPDTIENITLSGNADVQGNELGNLMRRGSGQNILDGMGGDDTLYGDEGDDQVEGGTGNDVVSGGAGQDRVSGGSGSDNVQGGAGNDRVYGDAGRDTVSGGSGNDFVEGGSGNDRLSGAAGQDRLYGGEGRDLLSGGLGNDWLFGGSAQDTLYGGSGHDRFVFDTQLNPSSNVDVIQDFTASEDHIVLEDAVFTALGKGSAKGVTIAPDLFVAGTQAQGAEDRIIYDQDTGSLYYDADGTGSTAQVKFAALTNKATLSHHDFLII
jgi:Ca2+-binding RTX toxin-like protein